MIGATQKLSGEYNIVVTHADGTTTESGWFDNIILNQGLDRIAFGTHTGGPNAGYSPFYYARVGTGTSTPVATQTQLDAQIAASQSGHDGVALSVVNSGSPTYSSLLTYKFTFAQGAVVGNITEVAVGWSSAGSTLFSRALIADGGGSPTSITIVALDQLSVFYRLRVSPPLSTFSGNVDISGTIYSYTGSLATAATFAQSLTLFRGYWGYETISAIYDNVTFYGTGSVLGPITGSPTTAGTAQFTTSTATVAYTPGSYYRDNVITFDVNKANVTGGITCMRVGWDSDNLRFQYSFTPAEPIVVAAFVFA